MSIDEKALEHTLSFCRDENQNRYRTLIQNYEDAKSVAESPVSVSLAKCSLALQNHWVTRGMEYTFKDENDWNELSKSVLDAAGVKHGK